MDNLHEALSAARLWLNTQVKKDSSLFGAYYAIRMTQAEIEESDACPIARCNMDRIQMNFEKIKEEAEKSLVKDLAFITIHEIMHIEQMHPLQGANMSEDDIRLHNYCADLQINELVSQNLDHRPGHGVFWDQDKENFKGVEDVLDISCFELMNKIKPEAKEKILQDYEGDVELQRGDEVKKGQSISRVSAEMAAAAQMSENQGVGTLPAHVDMMLENLNEPKASIAEWLSCFFTEIQKNSMNWSRRDVRWNSTNYYFPQVKGVGLDEIVISIDTSGSTMGEQVKQFFSETQDILRRTAFNKLHVLNVDAEVCSVNTYTQFDKEIKLELSGCGGTAFKPAFDWVQENVRQPQAIIYLTDGDGYDTESIEPPRCPVLWVLTDGDRNLPFGSKRVIDVSN